MRTLEDLLAALARDHGPRLAVACGERQLTFSELRHEAERWASALSGAGVGPGKQVGLLAANGVDWPAVAFGVWSAGATLVPISTFVTPRELEEIVAHADIDLLVTQPSLGSHDYLAAVAALGRGRINRVVVLGDDAGNGTEARAFLDEASSTGSPRPRLDPESIACILYTSGTTGRPKGVRLSHRAIVATVQPTATRTGLGPDDSMLSTLPLFWVAGLVIRALPTWATGCALLFVDTFTPEAILATLRRRRPTALHLRPPQVAEVLRHPTFDQALLTTIHRGNGRVAWFDGQLPSAARFITGYGMTEMAGYVTALDWRDDEETRHSGMGTPLPGVELSIVGADGTSIAAGATGAIRVRGPGMFSGYHKEAPGTGLDAEGWFITGDLGSVDEDGTFRFVGRSKDLLRVKGINVSPVEVEHVLAAHAGVEAAYAVGLPPDGLDQRLVVLVVARDDNLPAIEDQLRALARELLSHYKRPDAYVFLRPDEVAFGPTSKPQRAALAALAEARLRSA